MRVLATVLLLLWPGLLFAQDVATQARDALAALEKASDQLADARKARDRVRALTQTIQAFETGLSALREGLRRALAEEQQLKASLAAREVEIGTLLATLITIRPGYSPDAFLHPDGIEGAARAGMLLAEVSPALSRQAENLRRDLSTMELIGELQRDAAQQLQASLSELQQARVALSTAMADRTDLPRRFVDDPERAALLASAAATLDSFAENIGQLALNDQGWSPPDIDVAAGDLPLPVRGVILRFAGEADAAGIVRPGIVLATRPGALVTSPTAATIRYQGPLLDLGNVVILEPRADILFVFAGLEIAYGAAGQIITAGTPLGLMSGLQPEIASNSTSNTGERAGAGRTETLYIEVRQDNVPQDPTRWFRTPKDG